MKIKEAEAITHTLSKPGKMPGFAYSTPAHECKTGTKLRAVAGSVCANCYAYKRGRYRFQNVIDAQYKRFRSLTHPNTSPISMFHGHKITELVTQGLKLDACYSGWDACRLAIERVGSKA